jgi:hypothetical protein
MYGKTGRPPEVLPALPNSKRTLVAGEQPAARYAERIVDAFLRGAATTKRP